MTEPLRLGIAGLGTVGAAVIEIIRRHEKALAQRCGRPIEVVAVSARDRGRDRGIDLAGLDWFENPIALADSERIDCFVELIGGSDGPAKDAVDAAIAAGKHVVTANKAMLARHGIAQAAAAEARGVCLAFEASSAGGIPVVKTLREALAGNGVTQIAGILNGTCNYILSRMELEGLTFAECLKDAQRLGYAEADPTFDVEGFDTAHKLAILTSLAFGTEIDADAIHVEGISSIAPLDLKMADELGYRIKLLGVAERTEAGIEQRVCPTMVPKSSPIAQVMGVTNAVTIDADAVRQLTLVGPAPAAAPRRRRWSPTSPTSRAARRACPSACRWRNCAGRSAPRCSGTRAATMSGSPCSTARAPPPASPRAWRRPTSASKASCRSAPKPPPRATEGPLGTARAGRAHHLRHDRTRHPRRGREDHRRRPHRGTAAGHPDREGLAYGE